MKALIELINRLLRYFERHQRNQDNKRHEAEVDNVKRDPVDWFNGHFGGTDVMPNKPAPDSTDKADNSGNRE